MWTRLKRLVKTLPITISRHQTQCNYYLILTLKGFGKTDRPRTP